MHLYDTLPEFERAAYLLNGKVRKNDMDGSRPTLVHFWAVSCRLCKEAMPIVQAIRDKHEGKLTVLAIHMPASEADLNVEQVKETAVALNITEPLFIDNHHELADAFNNRYIPAYYVFDKFGKLRHYQIGDSGTDLLERRIDRVLAE